MTPRIPRLLLFFSVLLMTARASEDVLREEVRAKGWIVFAARAEAGDWDLFVMRPDGSHRRALTRTPDWNESAPQFSRDGAWLLYRRLRRDELIDGNRYGEQGSLMVARSDGTEARALGGDGEWPWASWSPDGREVACLSLKGISFVEVASGKTRRTLPRRGFFQQLTWSPDGRSLSGVSNAFGTSWSVARLDAITGEPSAVSRIDCCTPDWFPDSGRVVFSNRPPGQETNQGQGWTQLWAADADGKNPQLLYAEDGRHIYGGHVSPDGKYVLFTGNVQENGDPEHQGAPMGLMRLADAPLIGGDSPAVRALHPQARRGPVLTLPEGWEPCWTFSELPAGPAASAALADEVRGKGRLVFSAPSERRDWDLFVMRPDGSHRRALTATPDTHETGARFSPDGRRLLYYRAPRSATVGNNNYATFELVVADAEGRVARSLGEGHAWAAWSPDSARLATLARDGIHFLDAATGRDLGGKIPRHGFVQQLAWSPDGRAFAGTANGLGPFWNIGVLPAGGGPPLAVSETERYNCTPDWMPGSDWVLYSRGIVGGQSGHAQLWRARADGVERGLLYAEEGTHIYGGGASPDGRYLIFTRSAADLGDGENQRLTMSIIRLADTPLDVKAGATGLPRLDLGPGWEPHWTSHESPPTQENPDQ